MPNFDLAYSALIHTLAWGAFSLSADPRFPSFAAMIALYSEPDLSGLIEIADPDIPIYRTFRIIHLRKGISEKKMALVAPSLWEDPLENPVALCAIVDERSDKWESNFLGNFRKDVFGQCWSLKGESDAIWRIYSTVRKDPITGRNAALDDEGVRVRSTPRKLLQALTSDASLDPKQTGYCGIVNYFPLDTAIQKIAGEIRRSMTKAYSTDQGYADALLIKREEFEHECEVRLLVIDNGRLWQNSTMIFIGINPAVLFGELVLDPRLGADDVRDRIKNFELWASADRLTSQLFTKKDCSK